ncbi:recombinase family protein [Fictibacillus barbaricus]|nr:recombinase family protein [Fictibacillus barbaricus]
MMEKKHVFFRRVSTAGQDLTMQQEADLRYRDLLKENQILIINEDAISANKKSIKERPEMKQLIEWIANDRIAVLYAFDRTRLFRDYYEGMSFQELCLKHEVKIVYTSHGGGHIQATNDIFLEGFLGMFSDIEGKNIARRTAEARRRHPPKKFGYIKYKETKTYRKDSKNSSCLMDYFKDIAKVSNMDELCILLDDYKKKLNCDLSRLITLASDPFYAGYDLSNGNNALKHVEPYMTLEDYQKLQNKKSELFKAFEERIKRLEVQETFQPICGCCKRPLLYRSNVKSNTAQYSCSRKHQRVTIGYSDLVCIVEQVVREAFKCLDIKRLVKDAVLSVNSYKKTIKSEVQTLETQINKHMEELLLASSDYNPNWESDIKYKKLEKLKFEQGALLEALEEAENHLADAKRLSKEFESYLLDISEPKLAWLFSLFVHKIHVYPEHVDIEMVKFDYLTEIKKEFIYQGGESA